MFRLQHAKARASAQHDSVLWEERAAYLTYLFARFSFTPPVYMRTGTERWDF